MSTPNSYEKIFFKVIWKNHFLIKMRNKSDCKKNYKKSKLKVKGHPTTEYKFYSPIHESPADV